MQIFEQELEENIFFCFPFSTLLYFRDAKTEIVRVSFARWCHAESLTLYCQLLICIKHLFFPSFSLSLPPIKCEEKISVQSKVSNITRHFRQKGFIRLARID